MRISKDDGHTISGANYGAVALLKESEQTRRLGDAVDKILKEMGNTVINCTVDNASSNSESLKLRVQKANAQPVDLFISLHFNVTAGGYGTEVYTWKGKEVPAAKRVLANMQALGFRNRGIKDGSKLYVIKNTKAEAILIEVCFIDHNEDVKRYNENFRKVAIAIAEGVTGEKYVEKPNNIVNSQDVKGKTGVVTGNRVNARLDPVISSNNILGKFNKGDKVMLYRLEGDWYHCYSKFNTNRMYVHKDYVKVI